MNGKVEDLIFYSAAGLLGPLGLWLLWWSLLRDRARGRRRCPNCWYDLRGTPGMQCSECGFVARCERQLFRTRRMWRWAIASVIAIGVAGWLGLTPLARPHGWIGLAPRIMLLWMSAPGGRGDYQRQ